MLDHEPLGLLADAFVLGALGPAWTEPRFELSFGDHQNGQTPWRVTNPATLCTPVVPLGTGRWPSASA